MKDLARDEEADSDRGKMDNPRGHLGRDFCIVKMNLKKYFLKQYPFSQIMI